MASNNRKPFIIGTAIGAAIGAVTALLFAPKSGKELRGDIAESYKNVSEKTREIASAVGERTSEIASKVRETTGHIASDVRTWRESRREVAAASESAVEGADVISMDAAAEVTSEQNDIEQQ